MMRKETQSSLTGLLNICGTADGKCAQPNINYGGILQHKFVSGGKIIPIMLML